MSLIEPTDPSKFEQAASFEDDDFLLLPGLNKPWRRMPLDVLAAAVRPEDIKCKQERWDSGTIYSYESTVDSISVAITADQVPCVVHTIWRSSCLMQVNASSNGQTMFKLNRAGFVEDIVNCRLDLAAVGVSVTIRMPVSMTYQFPVTSATTLTLTVTAQHNGNCASASSDEQRFQLLVLPGATML